MKAPTKPEADALTQATAQAVKDAALKEKEANSDRFYAAKQDLFFCTEVVKLAACATAMQRSLNMIENAGKVYPAELKKIHGICDAVNDWNSMPNESIHWSLDLAAQRMQDASNTMEAAFMAAERGHDAQ